MLPGRGQPQLGRKSEGVRLVAVCYVIDQEISHTDVEADLQNLTAMTEELGYSPEQRDQLIGEVRRALDTNLFGAWRVTQALLPLLQRSPHPRVVMVSSEGGSLQSMSGGTPAYSVSKAALNALTCLLAGELRRHRILVNAICPGWVATDMGGHGGRPVAEGAAGIVWAATLPDAGPTGGFFRDGKPIPW